MKNKKVSLGDVIYNPISEIGGETIIKGIVIEVADDHVIMRADDVNYWLDAEDYYIDKGMHRIFLILCIQREWRNLKSCAPD